MINTITLYAHSQHSLYSPDVKLIRQGGGHGRNYVLHKTMFQFHVYMVNPKRLDIIFVSLIVMLFHSFNHVLNDKNGLNVI